MNPQPPINQALFGIYQENAATLAARVETFLDARGNLQKWRIPQYAQLSDFTAYEMQMEIIFQDAFVYDVVMGRALRTVPVAGEPAIEISKRAIYDECNYQAYALIVRSFSVENGGFSDSSGSPKDNGHLLWFKLYELNYAINADNVPHLKVSFYNSTIFRQQKSHSIDQWATEVRKASNILISTGHPISEVEKTLVFRKGLIREDLRTSLILPARTKTFDKLIVTAKAFHSSTIDTSSNSSQRIFATADSDTPCPHCLSETGRQFFHQLAKCRRRQGIGEYSRESNKRSRDDEPTPTRDVECYRCHEKGHYASRCPQNQGSSRSGHVGGRGRSRGERGGNYYLWVPEGDAPPNAVAVSSSKSGVSVPPPPGYVKPPDNSSFFGGVIHHCLFTEVHRQPHRWIFDTGCTAHSSYLREMFQIILPCSETMFAANGAPMVISGVGKAGPFEEVLFLPDLRINLFSHKQAMRHGHRITLSSDGQIFTVTLPSARTLAFVFDGTFWIWDDEESRHSAHALVSPSLEISGTNLTPVADFAAPISHSGAVQEFLLLHFCIGHMNYTTMLRALQAGTWTGFRHSLQHIHLAQLPRCPVCMKMKNKHRPVSNIGRFVQPRPGLLFHMDLKTVRTRSINHEHYIVDIIDDNSDKPWIYCLRKKSDAFEQALQVFRNTVCKPRGITFFALRIDNAGELTSHEVQSYCAVNGIHLVPVPAYRHALNGVAEKFFDTLLNMIRAMLESAHMPGYLWNYAARHSCQLIGDGPKAPDWTTPNFKWDGTPSDISVHRIFGCRVYTHVNRQVGTLEARGEEMRYLGYSHDTHFHHLYRVHDRRVFTTDDVTFVETDIQLPE
jgi:hypothetical protein